MKKILFIFVCVATILSASAQDVRVSLLMSEPNQERYYGVFGHVAIRIHSEELEADYVYSYVGDHMDEPWRLLTGGMQMGLRMKPTDVYLRQEFRTVTEYQLNLPNETTQALCTILFQEADKGFCLPYNPAKGSCTQMVWQYLRLATQRANTPIIVSDWADEYNESIVSITRRYTNGHPLHKIALITRYGLGKDMHDTNISKHKKVLFPAQLLPLLRKATINGNALME